MTAKGSDAATRQEGGFTLIEVLIVLLLLALLMGAIAGTIIVSLKATAGTSSRLSTSHDRQLVEVYLPRDLGSAGTAISNTASGHCTPAGTTSLLVLGWRGIPPTTQNPPVSLAVTYAFEADYVASQISSNWRLVRYYCNQPPGGSWSGAQQTTMVYGLQSQTAATVSCAAVATDGTTTNLSKAVTSSVFNGTHSGWSISDSVGAIPAATTVTDGGSGSGTLSNAATAGVTGDRFTLTPPAGPACNQNVPPPTAPWVTLNVTDTAGVSYSITGQMRTNSS